MDFVIMYKNGKSTDVHIDDDTKQVTIIKYLDSVGKQPFFDKISRGTDYIEGCEGA